MAIIIDQTRRVLVQGITGREGRARTRLMREYGTNVVAGCTPGKGGHEVESVPVFDGVAEAVERAVEGRTRGSRPRPFVYNRRERRQS